MFNSVMVIAPHPDDDILGCGGLMSRVVREGGKLTVLYANMESGKRGDEIENALALLPHAVEIGVYCVEPDGIKGSIKYLATWIQNGIEFYKPEVVCIPNRTAHHQDHRTTAEASIIATRPSGGTSHYRPPIVLEYEVAGDVWPPRNTIDPQLAVSIEHSDVLFKMDAMNEHKSQVRSSPSERSTRTILSLAAIRGSQAGVEYAEAYNVLRWVM